MTRGRSVTARVTYFVARRPDGVIGRKEYERHDPTTTWDDQGIAVENVREDYATLAAEIEKVINQFRDQQAAEMRAYGAAQVQEAVVDYICESDLELAVHEDQIIVSLDASAGDIELRPWWYLEDLLREAVQAGGVEVEDLLRGMTKRLLPEVAPSPRRRALPEPDYDEPEPPPNPRRAPAPIAKGRRRRAAPTA